ncbi:MAG: M23 family metallopeptidase [Candidatus Rokuibacteriota bacterium]
MRRAVVRTSPADLARYGRIFDQLRGQHDAGPLDERDLLALLRELGVVDASRPGGRAGGNGGRPAPVRQYPGAFRWPVQAGVVTSEFGPRWGALHAGIDIAAERGRPVLASAPGEVAYAGNQLDGYGNAVVLRHDARTTTLYAHNSTLRVRAGQRVTQGHVVALLGSTGRSTGPHLHFELRDGDRPIDPRKRLPPDRF